MGMIGEKVTTLKSRFETVSTLLLCFETLFFFFFFGPHSQHMEVPELGVKLELQLLATATAVWDPSHV